MEKKELIINTTSELYEKFKGLFFEKKFKSYSDLLEYLLTAKSQPENSIRSKFQCQNAIHSADSQQTEVSLFPVVDGSEENKSFAKYTPAGNVNLTISDETKAANYFNPGDEFFVDFTRAIPTVQSFQETEKPMFRFKFLAKYDNHNQRPVIIATDEQEARTFLKNKHPHATIHKVENIGPV